MSLTKEEEREIMEAQDERRLNLATEYEATYVIGVPETVIETGSQKKISDYVDEFIIQHMEIDGLTYDLQDVIEG